MAKSQRRIHTNEGVSFSIDIPSPGATVTADNMNMITVQVDDAGSTDDFAARIYDFSAASGIGKDPISGPTDFPGHTSSNKRVLSMSVGVIDGMGAGNNRVVYVENKDQGRCIGHPFQAEAAGSTGYTRKVAVKFGKPGQLVPVALTLKLDSKVTRGTCSQCAKLNQPTLLLFSDEANGAGGWYSRPVAFGGRSAPPGYWVLEKNSATEWRLCLTQGRKPLVTFTGKTKRKDCSLPITLQRKGVGSKVCKDWPKTVSISAAP